LEGQIHVTGRNGGYEKLIQAETREHEHLLINHLYDAFSTNSFVMNNDDLTGLMLNKMTSMLLQIVCSFSCNQHHFLQSQFSW
jgi:hypothetical protein